MSLSPASSLPAGRWFDTSETASGTNGGLEGRVSDSTRPLGSSSRAALAAEILRRYGDRLIAEWQEALALAGTVPISLSADDWITRIATQCPAPVKALVPLMDPVALARAHAGVSMAAAARELATEILTLCQSIEAVTWSATDGIVECAAPGAINWGALPVLPLPPVTALAEPVTDWWLAGSPQAAPEDGTEASAPASGAALLSSAVRDGTWSPSLPQPNAGAGWDVQPPQQTITTASRPTSPPPVTRPATLVEDQLPVIDVPVQPQQPRVITVPPQEEQEHAAASDPDDPRGPLCAAGEALYPQRRNAIAVQILRRCGDEYLNSWSKRLAKASQPGAAPLTALTWIMAGRYGSPISAKMLAPILDPKAPGYTPASAGKMALAVMRVASKFGAAMWSDTDGIVASKLPGEVDWSALTAESLDLGGGRTERAFGPRAPLASSFAPQASAQRTVGLVQSHLASSAPVQVVSGLWTIRQFRAPLAPAVVEQACARRAEELSTTLQAAIPAPLRAVWAPVMTADNLLEIVRIILCGAAKLKYKRAFLSHAIVALGGKVGWEPPSFSSLSSEGIKASTIAAMCGTFKARLYVDGRLPILPYSVAAVCTGIAGAVRLLILSCFFHVGLLKWTEGTGVTALNLAPDLITALLRKVPLKLPQHRPKALALFIELELITSDPIPAKSPGAAANSSEAKQASGDEGEGDDEDDEGDADDDNRSVIGPLPQLQVPRWDFSAHTPVVATSTATAAPTFPSTVEPPGSATAHNTMLRGRQHLDKTVGARSTSASAAARSYHQQAPVFKRYASPSTRRVPKHRPYTSESPGLADSTRSEESDGYRSDGGMGRPTSALDWHDEPEGEVYVYWDIENQRIRLSSLSVQDMVDALELALRKAGIMGPRDESRLFLAVNPFVKREENLGRHQELPPPMSESNLPELFRQCRDAKAFIACAPPHFNGADSILIDRIRADIRHLRRPQVASTVRAIVLITGDHFAIDEFSVLKKAFQNTVPEGSAAMANSGAGGTQKLLCEKLGRPAIVSIFGAFRGGAPVTPEMRQTADVDVRFCFADLKTSAVFNAPHTISVRHAEGYVSRRFKGISEPMVAKPYYFPAADILEVPPALSLALPVSPTPAVALPQETVAAPADVADSAPSANPSPQPQLLRPSALLAARAQAAQATDGEGGGMLAAWWRRVIPAAAPDTISAPAPAPAPAGFTAPPSFLTPSRVMTAASLLGRLSKQ